MKKFKISTKLFTQLFSSKSTPGKHENILSVEERFIKISDSIANQQIDIPKLTKHLLNCFDDNYINSDEYTQYEAILDSLELKNYLHDGKQISKVGLALLITLLLDRYNLRNQNIITLIAEIDLNDIIKFSLPYFFPNIESEKNESIKQLIITNYNKNNLNIVYSYSKNSYSIKIDNNTINLKINDDIPTDYIDFNVVNQFIECIKSDTINLKDFITKCVEFLVSPNHNHTQQFLLINEYNSSQHTSKQFRFKLYNGKNLTNFSTVMLFCLLTITHYKDNPGINFIINSTDADSLTEYFIPQIKKLSQLKIIDQSSQDICQNFINSLKRINYIISYDSNKGNFALYQKDNKELGSLDAVNNGKNIIEEKLNDLSSTIIENTQAKEKKFVNIDQAQAFFTRPLPPVPFITDLIPFLTPDSTYKTITNNNQNIIKNHITWIISEDNDMQENGYKQLCLSIDFDNSTNKYLLLTLKGYCLLRGIGTDTKIDEGLKFLEESANANIPLALTILGTYYNIQRQLHPDKESEYTKKSIDYLMRAMKLGCIYAILKLIDICYYSISDLYKAFIFTQIGMAYNSIKSNIVGREILDKYVGEDLNHLFSSKINILNISLSQSPKNRSDILNAIRHNFTIMFKSQYKNYLVEVVDKERQELIIPPDLKEGESVCIIQVQGYKLLVERLKNIEANISKSIDPLFYDYMDYYTNKLEFSGKLILRLAEEFKCNYKLWRDPVTKAKLSPANLNFSDTQVEFFS